MFQIFLFQTFLMITQVQGLVAKFIGIFAPSTKQANNSAFALTLHVAIHQVTQIPHLGFGCIVTIEAGMVPNSQQYIVTLGSYPEYSCPYFKEMSTKALGKRGQWANCKHLYYIFVVICHFNVEVDVWMHALNFSFNELK